MIINEILKNFAWIAVIIIRVILKKENKKRFLEKFTITNKKPLNDKKVGWIHCASVGELTSAVHFMHLLSKTHLVVATSITPESYLVIKNYCKDNKNIIHQFMPCDTKFFINRFLNHWKCEKLFVFESEFWPNMILETSKRGKLFLINGKLSDKSFKRWQYIRKYFINILFKYEKIYTASNEDLKKFQSFGFKNIEYTSHTKIDQMFYLQKRAQELQKKYKEFYQAYSKEDIVCFCSLNESEEDLLIPLMQKIIENNSKIIIIPRHLNRTKNINDKCKFHNINLQQFTQWNKKLTDVIIFDTFGKMPLVQEFSKVNIICGSFVDNIGGHNPLESIAFSKITIIGNYAYNAKSIIDNLKKYNAINILDHNQIVNFILNINDNKIKENELNCKNFIQNTPSISETILKSIMK